MQKPITKQVSPRTHTVLVAICLCVLSLLTTIPGASAGQHQTQHLEAGSFLIATPHISDYRFRRTVILIVRHDANGAFGLVINKVTDIPLSSLAPELRELTREKQFAYYGGPVSMQRMSYLHRERAAANGGTRVMQDIYWSTKLTMLKGFLASPDERTLRVFFGYAGWGPGQLDREVAQRGWLVAVADGETVFDHPTDSLWRELIRRDGGVWVRSGEREPKVTASMADESIESNASAILWSKSYASLN